MKRILILYYTQTGQQLNILQSLAKPLTDAGHHVFYQATEPEQDYAFPWSAFSFFNAFPEVFFQEPMALKKFSEKAFDDYDLVILGYQPWFLSPSRPISSFLQSNDGKRILKDKPAITVIGCRNMWLNAQEKTKRRLLDANAKLVGNVALIDRSSNLVSLVTILRWLLGGKKETFGITAGVSANDIEHAKEFGASINEALQQNNFDNLQTQLNNKGAVDINPSLVLMERRGQKGFSIWSKFIAAGGTSQSLGRKIRVYIFMYLLPTAVVVLSPLLWTISKTMLIVKREVLQKEVEYFKQNSLR